MVSICFISEIIVNFNSVLKYNLRNNMQYLSLIIPSFVSPTGEAEASVTNTDKGFFIYS